MLRYRSNREDDERDNANPLGYDGRLGRSVYVNRLKKIICLVYQWAFRVR